MQQQSQSVTVSGYPQQQDDWGLDQARAAQQAALAQQTMPFYQNQQPAAVGVYAGAPNMASIMHPPQENWEGAHSPTAEFFRRGMLGPYGGYTSPPISSPGGYSEEVAPDVVMGPSRPNYQPYNTGLGGSSYLEAQGPQTQGYIPNRGPGGADSEGNWVPDTNWVGVRPHAADDMGRGGIGIGHNDWREYTNDANPMYNRSQSGGLLKGGLSTQPGYTDWYGSPLISFDDTRTPNFRPLMTDAQVLGTPNEPTMAGGEYNGEWSGNPMLDEMLRNLAANYAGRKR